MKVSCLHFRAPLTVATVAAILGACAHAPGSFRLVNGARSPFLIPPGVKDTSVARASLHIRDMARKASCGASPSGLRIAGRSLIVSRESLAAATSEELNVWTASLEKNGCIGSGEAFAVRAAVIDALPLDLTGRRRLRGEALAITGSVDLTSVNTLRVVSPVFRAGAPPASATLAGRSTVSEGQNGSINVEIKPNPDLTGYEIAWYDIRQRDDGPGFHIVPRSAEIHIGGQVEQEPAPKVNQFVFESGARWFRYFVMTRLAGNDYNIVLLSAPTAADLEARTALFRTDADGYLRTADKASYAAMTREIGVNPQIRVKVNGVETDLPLGDSIRQAIEQSTGSGNAANALPHLSVSKLHGGKLTRVEWDRRTQDILNLTLEGGEQIVW